MTLRSENNVVEFKDGNVELEMSKPYKFECNVNDASPKPTISFTINNELQPSTNDQVKHFVTRTLKNKYFVTKSMSTIDFTVIYTNHLNNFSCSVDPNVPGLQPIVKNVQMHVKGVYIIESSCVDSVLPSADGSVLITCKFFAYPEPNVDWNVLMPTTSNADEQIEDTEDSNHEEITSRKASTKLENGDDYAILMEVRILKYEKRNY